MPKVLISDSMNSVAQKIFEKNNISVDVKTGLAEEEIIKMMIKQFKINIESQNLDFKKYGFNFHDLIILASIIQGEAMYKEEMNIISSVFHNRLNKKMF